MKKNINRTASKFELFGSELKLRDSYDSKIIICAYEIDRIDTIILDSHNVDHIAARNYFERIKERYDGITFSMVKEIISNCNTCRLDVPPATIPSVTPILSS